MLEVDKGYPWFHRPFSYLGHSTWVSYPGDRNDERERENGNINYIEQGKSITTVPSSTLTLSYPNSISVSISI